MAKPETYTIGELAREVDLPVETIRYYEREKLIPKPDRSAGNYRLYSNAQRDRLSFIHHCRSLDMTLDEVRSLLAAKDAPTKSCKGVNELIDAHIQHVADRIAELRALSQQLQALRNQCHQASQSASCAILKELSASPRARRKKAAGAHPGRTHRV